MRLSALLKKRRHRSGEEYRDTPVIQTFNEGVMFAIKNSNKTTRSTNKFIGVSQGMRQIKNQF